MTWSWPVSTGFTLRQLSRNGRFQHDGYVGAITRAALLADLIFDGRLSATQTDIVIDSAATGFAPADALLEAISAHPGWALDSWIGMGPPVQRLLIEELCKAGVIALKPGPRLRARYELAPGSSGSEDGARAAVPAKGSAQIATLDALCDIISYRTPTGDELAACGPAAWFVDALYEFVIRSRAIDAINDAARAGNG